MIEPESSPVRIAPTMRCATHPEVVADAGTCARCGNFMCAGCVHPGFAQPTCEPCVRRLEGGRFVSQVPALGIAMMIHGAMTIGVGLFAVVYGAFFAAAVQDVPTSPDPAAAPTEAIAGIIVGGMVGVGLLHFLPGVLQLLAGWRVRSYQSRGLAIAALASGLVSVLGCYCAPTSVGMLIWGLVVLLSEDVTARFAADPGSGR